MAVMHYRRPQNIMGCTIRSLLLANLIACVVLISRMSGKENGDLHRKVNNMHPLLRKKHLDPPHTQTPAISQCFEPFPHHTLTDRMNIALNSTGPGYVLSLCPNTDYPITAPIKFAYPYQEISTAGWPTGEERATFVVYGPASRHDPHTTAIDGTCPNCEGVKLRNIQINGNRTHHSIMQGGGNIEMGGPNSHQVIEYVRTYDPRGWTCLHIQEGVMNCRNTTVQHNDIGPCGIDTFEQWADGISYSCREGTVRNNLVTDPTDGGIVIFGSPGTVVENNKIWVNRRTLLGGINLVDVDPWDGDYSGVIVRNNMIAGGFATEAPSSDAWRGSNENHAFIKIGIAIGPRTWFGDQYYNNRSKSGIVYNNELTGAFGYGVALTSAQNFTVENNMLIGNTSFIGFRGPMCKPDKKTPPAAAFVVDESTVLSTVIQRDFMAVEDGDSLTCIVPPYGGHYWPYGSIEDAIHTAPVKTVVQKARDADFLYAVPIRRSASGYRLTLLVPACAAFILLTGARLWKLWLKQRHLQRQRIMRGISYRRKDRKNRIQ